MKMVIKFKKPAILLLALILSIGCMLSGAFALLSDQTEKVVNTFVLGDINITLKESNDLSFKLTPNSTLKKDPKLTVLADSVDCYIFAEIEESENLESFVSYDIADGWMPLTEGSNIYYREHSSAKTDSVYSILKNDLVTVKDYSADDVSSDTSKPTLSFTGYAIQKEGVDTPQKAWEILTKEFK